MLYRNFTDEPQWMVSGAIKRRVKSGEKINLSMSDLNHAGSNIRHFELVLAEETVKKKIKFEYSKETVVKETEEKKKKTERKVRKKKKKAKAKIKEELKEKQ